MAEAEAGEKVSTEEPVVESAAETPAAASATASAVDEESKTPGDSTATGESGESSTKSTTATITGKVGEHDYLIGAKVDLAFVLDTTGSMGSYIESARQSINDIAAKIKDEKIDVRFAFIPYKDHTDKPLTQVTDFTDDQSIIKSELDKQIASGGGDGPEAVGTGLFDARYYLTWRNEASKVIVLIADAPPHGLESSGDNYPNECPMTADRKKMIGEEESTDDKFIDILKLIRTEIRDELEATIYTVACEPSVSCSYAYCRDFMQFAAECTDGKFLPLTKAELLPPTIIGSVKQQIAMDALENRLDETMAQIRKEYALENEGKEPTDEEMDDLLTVKFQESGVQIDDVDVGELYVEPPSRVNLDLLLNDQECPTLKDFKAKRESVGTMAQSNLKFLPTRGSMLTRRMKKKGGSRLERSRVSRKKSKKSAPTRGLTEEGLITAPMSSSSSASSLSSAGPSASASLAPMKTQTVTMSRKAVSVDAVRKSRAKQSRKSAYRASKMY